MHPMLNTAVKAARKAGALISRASFDVDKLTIRSKQKNDFVSEVDHAAEDAIISVLREAYPDHGFLGEESGYHDKEAEYLWVIDPLDGTTNYLYRYRAWGVSVALEDAEGNGLVGVVHDPLNDETFAAERGAGASLSGEPIRVRDLAELERALVATGFGYDPDVRRGQAEVLLRVLPHVRDVRRAGAAALDLCHVAAGRLDGYYERGINHWDWAAGALIVREAGGAVVPLEGGRPGLAAAGPRLVEALAALAAEPT
jgi:myo-inositol-1(or 4)-monophosphatase